MAQQIANLGQGGSLLEHLSRQAVTEQVGASIGGLNSCSFQCPVHQRTNCEGVGEPDQRRFAPDEYATTGTIRSGLPQIVGHRCAHFDRQGHLCHPLAFAPDCDQAGFPVDIVQPQSHYFAGSQPQLRQHKQNGVVAPANRGIPIAGVQDTLDLLARKELRYA